MKDDLIEALNYISPSDLSYSDWVSVGMALKEEGLDVSIWDEWSKNDARYHKGECERKWATFNGSNKPITGGTIIQLAKDRGYSPKKSGCLDWNDVIEVDEKPIYNISTLSPVEQFKLYLKTLFKSDEYVGYVTNDVYFIKNEGRYAPLKGVYQRTCGELLESLDKYPDDLGATIGDWKEELGAFIRFNPLDGKDVKEGNITRFSYCLVECDDSDIKTQEDTLRRLEIPIAILTFSGKKSLHAIVKVDAKDLDEFKERVRFCYEFLQNKGLKVDISNKNPNKLSRLPGATRNGVVQRLIDVNIGYQSWNEWMESLGIDSELLTEDVVALVDNPPELAPELIEGLVRRGHKMLLSGASKSGKSFALIELSVCLSEGKDWLGFKCARSKVCYINLEIDRPSVIKRFKDMYEALKVKVPSHNIEIVNLRGKAEPLDKLAPKLVKKFASKSFDVIIIDPIYKVITGDENSATEMAHFCNQFDILCDKLHTTVIYAHHHPKGSQGVRSAQDRASGSGVFARDPDAIIDLTELDLDEDFKNNVSDDYSHTAWEVECITREFKKPKNRKVWFKYPLHEVDSKGDLDSFYPKGDIHNAQKASPNFSTPESRKENLDRAFDILSLGSDEVRLSDLVDYLELSEKTVRRYIKESDGEYLVEKGAVKKHEK